MFLFILRIVHSPFGQVLKAIRENEPRAISLGYDVDRYKLLAFVLSAALAGLAGSLKTLVLGFATLSDVHWALSGEVILMTLLGGMGTFAGPVLGAFTIIGLQNLLADRVGSWVTVIIGFIFVVCVVAFRRGFVGELQAWLKRRANYTGATAISKRGEMSKRMTKGELQDRWARFNPVGHAVARVRRRRVGRPTPQAALRTPASRAEDILVYTVGRAVPEPQGDDAQRQRRGRLRLRDHADAPLHDAGQRRLRLARRLRARKTRRPPR